MLSNEGKKKQELFGAARSAPAPIIERPSGGDWAKGRKSESLFEQARRAPRPDVEVPFGNWSKINSQTRFKQARRAPLPAPELPFGDWSRGKKSENVRGPLLIEASRSPFEEWVGYMLRRSVR